MSENKIKRFPYSVDRIRRINTNKRVVPCQISARWLQFPPKVHIYDDGSYLSIDVMTSTLGENLDERERKLCELVLFKEDLEQMLKEFDKEENQT